MWADCRPAASESGERRRKHPSAGVAGRLDEAAARGEPSLRASGRLRVATGDAPIVDVAPVLHTHGMEYALTTVTDLGLLTFVSLPLIVATVLLVASVFTRLAGWFAMRLEELRVAERTRL